MDLQFNYSRGATLHQLFIEAVVACPERPALIGEEGAASYADLLNYAQNFSLRLRLECSVRPGARIGIACGRSFATVGAILGILMAGAAYVPFDPAGSPEHLLTRQINDSDIELMVMDEKSMAQSCSQWWGVVKLLRLPEFFESSRPMGEVHTLFSEGQAASAAYVMFTSGSTGTPKGVVVPHRAISRLVSAQNYMQFGPEERFLLHSPLGFDASTLELWGALLHGATLVIAPDRVLGVEDYAGILRNYGITTMWMTAAVFHLAAQHSPTMFAPLGQLLVGGDVVMPERVKAVQIACPRLQIINGYGPTESTTFALCYRIPADVSAGVPLPIGQPIAHTQVYVLNEQHKPVAEGDAGELAIGGDGVALGYISQPELTAERFIDGSFIDSNTKLYLTGDRVQCDRDGVYHFLGRFDREQKISGKRVDLDDVESAIAQYPMVRQAAAFTITGEDGNKQLYAAVSFKNEDRSNIPLLHAHLANRLPKAAIPSEVLEYPELPINQNGKLDRSSVQRDVTNTLDERRRRIMVSAPPEDTLDVVLALWSKLLHREVLDEEANFFDLGGSSLLLIEMHASLSKTYPGSIEMMDLFSATTPIKISELIESKFHSSDMGLSRIAV